MSVQERLTFAVDAAREAGERTLHAFRSRRFGIHTKDDGTPVTDADRDTESMLRSAIEGAFPDDAILGEEFDDKPGTSGYRWLLDPIDGTKSFVHGVPLYGTLVAVERDEQSVAGVIRMPALDESVYASDGGGAWHVMHNEKPVEARVSGVARVEDALMCTTGFEYFHQAGHAEMFLRLCESFKTTRGWSDCYAHVLAATGRADVVVEPGISPWDIGPMTVIMREAGGRYTGWNGEESAYAPNGVSTNGALHKQVLALLR